MRTARIAVATAIAACTSACLDGTAPIPEPTIPLAIRVCALQTPDWIAIRNERAAWMRVYPEADGVLRILVTPALAIATVRVAGGNTVTEVFHTTAEELGGDASVCATSGTLTLAGSVAGLAGEQVVNITAGRRNSGATASVPSWEVTLLPAAPLDLITTRYPSTAYGVAPDRVIVRRGITPSATPLTLDFGAAEALAPLPTGLTFTNVNAGEVVSASTAVFTVNGSVHQLWSGQGAGSFTAWSLPDGLRASGDLHMVAGAIWTSVGNRELRHFYATPVARSLAFGPMVNVPSVEPVATAPYLRVRARLASQPEYRSAASIEYIQPAGSLGSRYVRVIVTAGHVGQVPATWELEIPDMSAAGYQPSWGLQSQPYSWWAAAHDGTTGFTIHPPRADGQTIATSSRSGSSP